MELDLDGGRTSFEISQKDAKIKEIRMFPGFGGPISGGFTDYNDNSDEPKNSEESESVTKTYSTITNPLLLNNYNKNKNLAFSELLNSCEFLENQPEICQVASDSLSSTEIYQLQISFFDNFERTVTEVEVDSWEKVLFDIIGSLGFFLGFSVITFVEFFVFFSDLVKTVFSNKVEP